MNTELKLLELANERAAQDPALIAYEMDRYIQIEKTSREKLIERLKCSIENFYKLGLCGTPNVGTADYLERLNTISGYIGVSTIELNAIIKRVNAVMQLSSSSDSEQTFLMAARDKEKKDK